MRPIVFLHIPKTAGQTVHAELAKFVGSKKVSPIRVHSQAPDSTNFPAGYNLYSGHLDWPDLDQISGDPFVFSILRDPRERIASFYFFLEAEARGLSDADLEQPTRQGLKAIKTLSADDYFLRDTPGWQGFIRSHYDNFYCAYFATQKVTGWPKLSGIDDPAILDAAMAGINRLDRLYINTNLGMLEDDMRQEFNARLNLTESFINKGPIPQSKARWPMLMERLKSTEARDRLAEFTHLDLQLMDRVGLSIPS